MANKVKIVLDSAGIQELLKCGAMQKICKDQADKIQQRAGDGFEVTTMVGKTRCNARVEATTREAYFRNLHGNILLKAMGGKK